MNLRAGLISASLAIGAVFAGPVAADARAEALARIDALSAQDLAVATSNWLRSMQTGCQVVLDWAELGDDLPDGLAQRVFDQADTPEALRPKLVSHLQNLDNEELGRQFEQLVLLEFEIAKDAPERTVLHVRDCTAPGA